MGKRQMAWARRERDRLLTVLGDKCKECGKTRKLEFDCIEPNVNNRHWRQMSWDTRMRFYRDQHAQGNLQILCYKCHRKKTPKQNPF